MGLIKPHNSCWITDEDKANHEKKPMYSRNAMKYNIKVGRAAEGRNWNSDNLAQSPLLSVPDKAKQDLLQGIRLQLVALLGQH